MSVRSRIISNMLKQSQATKEDRWADVADIDTMNPPEPPKPDHTGAAILGTGAVAGLAGAGAIAKSPEFAQQIMQHQDRNLSKLFANPNIHPDSGKIPMYVQDATASAPLSVNVAPGSIHTGPYHVKNYDGSKQWLDNRMSRKQRIEKGVRRTGWVGSILGALMMALGAYQQVKSRKASQNYIDEFDINE